MRSMKLFLLLVFLLLEAYGYTDETDKQALLEFKSQVSQDKRVVLSSWNNSSPVCSWFGVTCGRKHKRVTRLDLGGLKLGGFISPSIGNLSFLISINLTDNSLRGTIPEEVGNLFRLEYLYMRWNFLEGGIPIGLYNCSRLLWLRLSRNQLGKGVSSKLGSLTKLVILDIARNNLEGKIPASIGNLTSLREFGLNDNSIRGIHGDIARLTEILYLDLSMNHFSGGFPQAIYNLSSLLILNIFGNGFLGSLRPDIGIMLPNIIELYMGENNLTGVIPITLTNISTITKLGMESNKLTGNIPPSLGKISTLQNLRLVDNLFGSYSSKDLEFLGALTNCTKLQVLDVSDNRLGGDLPISLTNLSTNLVFLDLGENLISGSIPHDIGNLINLQYIGLYENMLTGLLPISIGKLLRLEGIKLWSNRMSGEIPSSLGNITRLVGLALTNNSFQGIIPPSLANCSYLQHLRLGANNLSGSIPQEIIQILPLLSLDMSGNSLTGSLPKDFGANLVGLSVANNKLSGQLPYTLGNCLSMEQLYLQGNSFDGSIPDIRRLMGIRRLDFSNNNLFGSIPEYLSNFSKLEYLNLSINDFEGKVPTEGVFQNATILSVSGNRNLCGGIKELQLKPCVAQAPPMRAKQSSRLKKVVIGVSVGIALLLLLFIASVSLRLFRKRKKNQETDIPTLGAIHERISYGDLRNATDGFSSSNMIGSGSFGTVFKAFFPAENKVVAVKVLNLERRGAMKSFMAECESLKNTRHRNLVKLLTACSSVDFQGNDFRALIYEFMPNGSLDTWLHPEDVEEIHRPSRTLTLFERLNIAIDVASVFDYLHVHCHEPIAHCDLKPSNVLLDDDLTAHVSDFGLARLLLKFNRESFLDQLSSAGVRGTIGYTAPEYGTGGTPSIHGDVYSFGVFLLEMFSGKRPTNESFGGNFTLQSYTKSALPERVLDIADKSILQNGGLRVGFPVVECLTLVSEMGLRCCEESPTKRCAISEVVRELISIKERFFKVTNSTTPF